VYHIIGSCLTIATLLFNLSSLHRPDPRVRDYCTLSSKACACPYVPYVGLQYHVCRIFSVLIRGTAFYHVDVYSRLCVHAFVICLLQSKSDFKNSGIHFSPSECQFVMAGNSYFRGMASQASCPTFRATDFGAWKVTFLFFWMYPLWMKRYDFS